MTTCRAGERNGSGLQEEHRFLRSGAEYDLYCPSRQVRKTFIILHGSSIQGRRDSRLINFARALAGSGIRVAAPCLNGLKSFRFALSDIDILKDLALELHRRYGQKIGVIGFSIGAGYALVAAGDRYISELIDPLILFGPHYSLSRTWQGVLDTFKAEPDEKDNDAWDGFLWVQFVLAYRTMGSSRLSPEEKTELTRLLHSFCDDASLESRKTGDSVPRKMGGAKRDSSLAGKREFYEKSLKGMQPSLREPETYSPDILESLSPSGKLDGIRARVYLLHDPHDCLVPCGESERIIDELDRRNDRHIHALFITPLISHVRPRRTWKVWRLFRLMSFLGEIFR